MGEAAYLSKHKVDLQRSFYRAIPDKLDLDGLVPSCCDRLQGHRNDRHCIWSCSYHCNVCYHLLDVSCHCYAVKAFTFVIVFGLLLLVFLPGRSGQRRLVFLPGQSGQRRLAPSHFLPDSFVCDIHLALCYVTKNNHSSHITERLWICFLVWAQTSV
ncbi:hypothetical protein NC653_000029 [Populus alba x Populus x berolinensis]|uniref:Uncharacterized protein n=1 Tax=Populus alba x Populus x berolinensis TaxID=444605 RepID=A0AAD6WEC3_9ROSI|nr:hypothetical protein NC653_000029 [Populus alba x Populus x berolinensis]